MDVRRDVIERLDSAEIACFVTGSEAMAIHGLAYRTTNDIDLVIRLDPGGYETRLRPALEPAYDCRRIVESWPGLDLDYVRAQASVLGLSALLAELVGDAG